MDRSAVCWRPGILRSVYRHVAGSPVEGFRQSLTFLAWVKLNRFANGPEMLSNEPSTDAAEAPVILDKAKDGGEVCNAMIHEVGFGVW